MIGEQTPTLSPSPTVALSKDGSGIGGSGEGEELLGSTMSTDLRPRLRSSPLSRSPHSPKEGRVDSRNALLVAIQGKGISPRKRGGEPRGTVARGRSSAANPRAALLSAIQLKSKPRDAAITGRGSGATDPRAALLNAIESKSRPRDPAVAGGRSSSVDPRTALLSAITSKSQPPLQPLPLPAPGDNIDLSDLTGSCPGIFDHGDRATVVALGDTGFDGREDGMWRTVVVLGEHVVLTAQQRRNEGWDGKASIVWRARRIDVSALTLTADAIGAELSLMGGGRFKLSFGGPQDCLRFAQAFFRTGTSMLEPIVGNKSVTGEGDSGEHEEATKLSKEDREVLDRYHRLMREAPGKHSGSDDDPISRLASELGRGVSSRETSRNASWVATNGSEKDGALTDDPRRALLAAIMPKNKGGSTDTSGGGLTEDEERIASKFKKMLNIGIPPDAVRHALIKDGIGPKISDAVLGTSDTADGNLDAKGGAGGLSQDESTVASKYRKMLKMGLPPDAVQHALTKDGVGAKIADAVLGTTNAEGTEDKEKGQVGAETKVVGPVLTGEEENIASKYQKMLKIFIPPDAVRHKMTMDGVDIKIVNTVLGPLLEEKRGERMSNTVEAQVVVVLTENEENIASKYRKMLKISIPVDAVRHSMTKDGVSARIAEAVLGPEEGTNTASVATPAPLMLTKDEEVTADRYRKMLRVNIPPEAVQHSMLKDGVDQKIVVAVIGSNNRLVLQTPHHQRPPLGGRGGPSTEGRITGNRRRRKGTTSLVKLHWTPLSPSALAGSVWGDRSAKKRRLTDNSSVAPGDEDVARLEQLFQSKKSGGKGRPPTPGNPGTEGESKNIGEGGKAGLMDLNRANNVAISLKAFDDFSHLELADTIGDLDPDGKIRGERVQFLGSLLPNPGEVAAIRAYKGDKTRLIPTERFFQHLLKIPRIESKVAVLQTISSFTESASATSTSLILLSQVCSSVMKSINLPLVLKMVLDIGNIMNEGTRTGEAGGFKLDSLQRLTQTKSMDGKITVLDYIVETFIGKGQRDVLELNKEFPNARTASRILLSDLIGEVKSLRVGLNKSKAELTKMKTEQSDKRVTRSMANNFAGVSGGDDPRKSLLSAIKGNRPPDNSKKNEEPATGNPRNMLLAAIKSKGGEGNKDKQLPQKSSPGVVRLEKFIVESNKNLTDLEKRKDDTVRVCKDLAIYFGESGGERSSSPLLSVLCEFISSLQEAVKKYNLKKEAEARKEAAREKRRRKEEEWSKAAKAKRKEEDAKGERGRGQEGKKDVQKSTAREQPQVGGKVQHETEERVQLKKKDDGPSAAVGEEARPQNKIIRGKKKGGLSPPLKLTTATEGSLVMIVNQMLTSVSPKTKAEFARGKNPRESDNELLKTIYEREKSLGRSGTGNSDKDAGFQEVSMSDNATSSSVVPDPRQEMLHSILKLRRNGELVSSPSSTGGSTDTHGTLFSRRDSTRHFRKSLHGVIKKRQFPGESATSEAKSDGGGE